MSDLESDHTPDKEEHKRLASFVKGVHADLRKKFKSSKCKWMWVGVGSNFKPQSAMARTMACR